jgi:hypothetical protein
VSKDTSGAGDPSLGARVRSFTRRGRLGGTEAPAPTSPHARSRGVHADRAFPLACVRRLLRTTGSPRASAGECCSRVRLSHKPPASPAGSFLRVGSENGHRIRRAHVFGREVVALSSAGAPFRERAARLRKRLYATASRERATPAGYASAPAADEEGAWLASKRTLPLPRRKQKL